MNIFQAKERLKEQEPDMIDKIDWASYSDDIDIKDWLLNEYGITLNGVNELLENNKAELKKEEIEENKPKDYALEFIKQLTKKALTIIILGKRGCLPKGTLIKTPNGRTSIEKVKNVFSYNLRNNKVEIKKAKVFNSGLKQVIKLHTSKGIIECSSEHKWIVVRDKQIMTIKTQDLNITDYLLLVKPSFTNK